MRQRSPTLLHCKICVKRKLPEQLSITHSGRKIMIAIYDISNAVSWVKTLQYPLRWRHNGHDSVSNHQPHDCLFNRSLRRRSKKTSKLRVTGLCVGNSPGTGEFPAQMASNAENVSIWWRHHDWNLIEICGLGFIELTIIQHCFR